MRLRWRFLDRRCQSVAVRRGRHQKRRDAGRARGAPVVDAVLAQTLVELAESGVEGLRVERIAERAAVNKTSVYRRWPTREALVSAALEGVLRSVSAQLPDTGALREDLLGVLRPVARLMGDPMGRALFRAAATEASAASVASLAARMMEQQSRSPVRVLVRRAVSRGEWRVGARGDQVISMLVGAIIHRSLLERAPLSDRWLTSLVELALQGVQPRRRARGRRRPA